MRRVQKVLVASIVPLVFGSSAALAQQGPCTSDIAQLRQTLAKQSGLGGPVSEPSAGLNVGAKTATNRSTGTEQAAGQQNGSQPNKVSGGSPGTVGGAAGTVATAAGGAAKNGVASGEVATSAADVRRQSEGLPTTAQQAASGQSGAEAKAQAADRVSEAKNDLQRAVDLNAKDDASCKQAVADARNLMPQQP